MSGEFARPNNQYQGAGSRGVAAVGTESPARRGNAGRPESMPGVEKPLDLEQLVRRCLGRIDLAERLLKSFESRFPEDLSRIEECLHEPDSPDLPRLVHQLKGAAANVSAPALHAIMTRMEDAVRAEQREEAGQCLEEVHQAWDRYLEFKSATQPRPSGQGCN